jgi:predicted kinase
MDKKVFIMRGVQGSGKSTYASMLHQAAFEDGQLPLTVSADHFFVGPNGYQFDVTKLGDAHKECMQRFIRALNDGMNPVIVDNTNINVEDVAPYVAVGEALDYKVTIIQVNTPPDVAAKRNIHGVAEKQVHRTHERLQHVKLPSRYTVSHVDSDKVTK